MTTKRRYYATTPIYYVNDKPHIGHAYCTVLVDTMTRYARLMGRQTWFLTGTDEHGQKVQEAAARRAVSEQAHVDELHRAFKELWPLLHVDNDDFIRTTEPRHTRVVQTLLQRLYDQGEIYAKDYEGWYSTAAERFWTEKDLVEGKCPDTGQDVQKIRERNYFFRMSKYGERLAAHIKANPGFLRPEHRANEVLGFLDQGLEDLCISRPKTRLSWGIELPFDAEYVTYVWFDALINYISAIGAESDDPARRAEFEAWWGAAHHFIGKDILTTHAVYWTTMLMALELPLPQSIIATGWWLMDNSKMSKSVGNVVSPLGMKDVYGPDVLRYFLMRDMVIGQDANFSEELLVRRNNSDLANDLGNLARRVGGLVGKWFEGRIPDPGAPTELEEEVAAHAARLEASVPEWLDELKLHTAIEETMQFVRALNKYVTTTEPYRKVKTDPAAAGRALYTALEGLRHAATLLHPVMPEKMSQLLSSLGEDPRPIQLAALSWGGLEPGTPLGMEQALFPRRDMPKAPAGDAPPQEGKGKSNKKKKKDKPKLETPDEIDFADFVKVDLRVATVLSAEPLEGSDKLLKLQLDLGKSADKRQVLAGVAEHLSPGDLVGRQIVMVFNLAPRKIRGEMSEGMILAADTPEGGVALVSPLAEVAPGTRVH